MSLKLQKILDERMKIARQKNSPITVFLYVRRDHKRRIA